jgi:hypothetical protein
MSFMSRKSPACKNVLDSDNKNRRFSFIISMRLMVLAMEAQALSAFIGVTVPPVNLGGAKRVGLTTQYCLSGKQICKNA